MNYYLVMNDIRWLIRISRPRFWLYVFGPFLVGTAGAIHTNTFLIDRWTILFAVYFLFPANLLIYGVNDIFDYETDRLNEKKRSYEAALLPDFRKKLALLIIAFNLPFVLAAAFHSLSAFLLLSAFLFLSIFYSAPPVRAKAIPFVDSVFNILYMMPGILAYHLVTSNLPPASIILAASLWTMAMHAYSAVPDIEADRQAGIATIATNLGSSGTLIFCALTFAAAAVLLFPRFPIVAASLGAVYVLMIVISFNYQTRLFSFYRLFPFINAMCGFVLFWTAVLSR